MDWDKVLDKFSKDDLLRFNHELNEWIFPVELSGYKPEDFDDIPDYNSNENLNIRNKYDDEIFSSLVETLKKKLTQKEISMYHHLEHMGNSKIEFYIWWYKKRFCKFFKLGFYSDKKQERMRDILVSISKSNNQEQLKNVYRKNGSS